MKLSAAAVAAFVAGAIATPTAAQETRSVQRDRSLGLTFSTGVDYSIGDYGAPTDTKILVVPFSGRVRSGPFTFRATIPYLRIDGPGNIVGGGDGGPIIIDPNDPTPREVRDGLGDLSLSAGYSLPEEALGGFEVELGGRVKLPTSSERRRLGTGETDFAVNLEVARPIGNAVPFVELSYRMPGDPAGFDLRNTVSTSVGTTLSAGAATLIGSYDYSGAASRLAEDSHSLFLGANFPVGGGLSLTGYGTAGLSNGAPDYGVGLLLSARVF
jgi:hypothetical protein